jgi:hypothetical protein
LQPPVAHHFLRSPQTCCHASNSLVACEVSFVQADKLALGHVPKLLIARLPGCHSSPPSP